IGLNWATGLIMHICSVVTQGTLRIDLVRFSVSRRAWTTHPRHAPTLERHGLGRGLARVHDGAANALDRRTLRVVEQVRVPVRGRRARMSEQRADQRQ